MYFIARNNKIYNYIAHMSSLKRYCCVMGILVMVISGWLYCIYYPLQSYQILYMTQYNDLQKKHAERSHLEHNIKDNGLLIDTVEKTIELHVLSAQDADKHFKANTLYILDLVSQSGLTLHSYDTQKIKDKKWYRKNSAHLDVSGSFESCSDFIKHIYQSQKMITISRISFVRSDNNTYRMSCDLSFVQINS